MTAGVTWPPDLSDVLPPGLGVDPVAFAEWLITPLGQYDVAERRDAARMTREEELAELAVLVPAFRAICRALEPGGLPPAAEGLMADILYRARGEHLHELTAPILPNLYRLRLLAERAQAAICDADRQRPGRRPSSARDRLLRVVSDKLREAGLKAELARDLAAQVLLRFGVPVPANDVDRRRAVRRATKGEQK